MAKITTKVAIAALALSLSAVSLAQSNGPTGFSVRVGAFFPNSGSSRIGVGLDYKLQRVTVPAQKNGAQPAYLGLALDYYGDSESYAIPFVVTYNVRASRNFLAFAGLGADYSREQNNDGKVGFAGQLGASYEFATAGEDANPGFTSSPIATAFADSAFTSDTASKDPLQITPDAPFTGTSGFYLPRGSKIRLSTSANR